MKRTDKTMVLCFIRIVEELIALLVWVVFAGVRCEAEIVGLECLQHRLEVQGQNDINTSNTEVNA